jgi:hypothetical protein
MQDKVNNSDYYILSKAKHKHYSKQFHNYSFNYHNSTNKVSTVINLM